MASIEYVEIAPQPGIQRDGTDVDHKSCSDGVWTRFYKARPMKMGGYELIKLANNEIIRNLVSFDSENSINLYVGQPSSLSTFLILNDLTTTASFDITPSAYSPNVNNTWSITSVAYTIQVLGQPVLTDFIIATATQNGTDISNKEPGAVYYGQLGANAQLQPLVNQNATQITTAGGVFNLGSYILVYGANGFITWNDALSLDNWPSDNFAQLGTSKFVYAAAVRSGNVINGIIWSLSAVISINFVGNDSPQFQLAYLSTVSTIISQSCVVSFDPFFFWIGINTFYTYNGSVQVLPNDTNKLWFFANLNTKYKEKVYGFVNKKFNEIWWLFPYGDSVENNWAIIYNMDTQSWYDTPLNRSCAVSSTSQMPYPIMASSLPYTLNNGSSFPIWIHEYGLNAVDPSRSTAIVASFQSNMLWNPQDKAVVCIDTFIPDVVMQEDMQMQVQTRGYPNSPALTSNIFTFNQNTEFLTVRVKGSIWSATFSSNVLNGNFLFGRTTFKTILTDDARPGPSTT